MKDSESKIRVCVPICEPTADGILKSLAAAEPRADLIEIRFDCLRPDEFRETKTLISRLVQQSSVPLIVTLRSKDQGGRGDFSKPVRHEFWANIPSGNFYVDVELDFVSSAEVELDWEKVICSHHDFQSVPEDLDQIYERLAATKASVLKIAIKAGDVTDCLSVFRLLKRAKEYGRALIAIAMGEAGLATRVLGPSRGSYLTYAPIEPESATAPGQVTASDLRDLYRIDQITPDTLVAGLVGNPITHSFSPHIHNAALRAADINGVYLPFAVNNFEAFMSRMVRRSTREIDWNLRGLSITAPYKAMALESVDWADQVAKEIGAVNTLVLDGEQIRGYNTDADGFIAPIKERRGDLRGLKCAVIGAGGASRMATWSLQREGALVTVFARNMDRATELARNFKVDLRDVSEAKFEGFDVVVNATPVGTKGMSEELSLVGGQQLRGNGLAYDLVYNPTKTRFLSEAESVGCETVGGLEMLINQAARQFELWTGQPAPRSVMQTAAQQAISRFN